MEGATPRGAGSTSIPERARLPVITDLAAVQRVFGWYSERCPLPGHDGWAEPVIVKGMEISLSCDCLGQELKWDDLRGSRALFDYRLADCFYAIRSGTVLGRGDKLSRGQRMVWRLLLTHELGLIEPMAVDLPPLPPFAEELHERAREFFALLAGLRLGIGGELEMPFPDRLLAAWLRTDRESARAAINELRAADVIVVTRRTRSRGPYLFLPGPMA